MSHIKLYLTPNEAGIHIYKPGDVLKGCVELSINRKSKYSSLYLNIVGQIFTKTYNESNKLKGKCSLFNKKITFFDYLTPVEIPNGKYQHDFEFELPSILPYSIDIDDKNKIEYFAEAIIIVNKKLHNVQHQYRQNFEIINEYDLNQNPLNFIGQKCEGVIQSCPLFCEKGSIMFSSSIPYTGFVEGQIIPVTIKYVNQSNIKIFGVNINLMQLIEIKCDHQESEITEFENLISSKKFPDPDLEQNIFCFIKQTDEFKIFMTVPFGIFLSNSHVCDLIQVKYYLDVTIITNACLILQNLELRMPIEIGTKKIRPFREIGNPATVVPNFNSSESQVRDLGRDNIILGTIDDEIEPELNRSLTSPPEFNIEDHRLVSLNSTETLCLQEFNSNDKPPEYSQILPSYDQIMNPENKTTVKENHETQKEDKF